MTNGGGKSHGKVQRPKGEAKKDSAKSQEKQK